MDHYCKNCAMPVEFVGTRVLEGAENDVWEHKDFNPNCGEAELNTPDV